MTSGDAFMYAGAFFIVSATVVMVVGCFTEFIKMWRRK